MKESNIKRAAIKRNQVIAKERFFKLTKNSLSSNRTKGQIYQYHFVKANKKCKPVKDNVLLGRPQKNSSWKRKQFVNGEMLFYEPFRG